MRISADIDELEGVARSLLGDRAALERVALPTVLPAIGATRRFDQSLDALTRGLQRARHRVSDELERFEDALTGVARDVADAEAERTAVIRAIARGAGLAL
jgi:hypothetical protein